MKIKFSSKHLLNISKTDFHSFITSIYKCKIFYVSFLHFQTKCIIRDVCIKIVKLFAQKEWKSSIFLFIHLVNTDWFCRLDCCQALVRFISGSPSIRRPGPGAFNYTGNSLKEGGGLQVGYFHLRETFDSSQEGSYCL